VIKWPRSVADRLVDDEPSRDALSRLIFGTRISLLMAFGALAGALPLGAALGVTGGYAGGWTDQLVTRTIDILLAFPTTLLALVVIASLGPSPTSVVVALGVAFFPAVTRIACGAVLRERSRDYVLTARSIGQSPTGILDVASV